MPCAARRHIPGECRTTFRDLPPVPGSHVRIFVTRFNDLPLRPVKGILIALQFHHKAEEGRLIGRDLP